MESIMEFLRLYLPTIVSTVMTVVIPLLIRYVFVRKMNGTFGKIDSKLCDSLDKANIEDIRKDLKELREAVNEMRGKPSKGGKN